MANEEFIFVRVLEHDTCDQIRIGMAYPIHANQVEKAAESVKALYGEKLEWCGGFERGCKEYYLRIALVNADTLDSIAEVWNK